MKPFKKSAAVSLITYFLLLASSISITQADELVVPVGQQGAEKMSLDRPKVGMTSVAVETRFGTPLKKSAAVGKPPISIWEYPHYSVYFESDRVIHSVLKPFSDEAAVVPAAATPAATPLPAPDTTIAPAAEASPAPAPAVTPAPAPEAPAPTPEATPAPAVTPAPVAAADPDADETAEPETK